MNKAQRIAAFVNEKPEVMPKIMKTAVGTSIWRSEKDYLVMDVSVSYAYTVSKTEHRKFLRAKHISDGIESITTGTPTLFTHNSGLTNLTVNSAVTPTESKQTPTKKLPPRLVTWRIKMRRLIKKLRGWLRISGGE
jgi:hypothetical protein